MRNKKILIVGVIALISILLGGCGIQKEETKNVDEMKQITNSNCGNYVEHEGNLYFWKLTDATREKSALYGKFGPVADAKTNLIRRKADGTEEVVLSDSGNGKIYISNNTIFYQLNENGNYNIYSVDMNGNNKKSYVKGEIEYACGDHVYIQSEGNIVVLNTKSGKKELTIQRAEIVGMFKENVYYLTDKDNNDEVSVNYIKETTTYTNLATVNRSEYQMKANSNIVLYGFSTENNKVTIKLGNVQGTAHFVQEGFVIEMDADGQNVTKKIDENAESGEVSLLGLTDLCVDYDADKGLIYTDPENGNQKTIMDNSKIKSELGFDVDGEDGIVSVYIADKIGNNLYVVSDNGVHYAAEDIGWRPSYRRAKTAVVKFDLGSGECSKLYEF